MDLEPAVVSLRYRLRAQQSLITQTSDQNIAFVGEMITQTGAGLSSAD